MKALVRFISEEDGVTAVEYGLIAAIVAASVMISFTGLQGSLFNAYAEVVFGLNPLAWIIRPF